MDKEQAAKLRAETPEADAVALIKRVLREGHPICVAWSAGKDSSVLLDLTFTAAIDLAKEGVHTPILVTHSNTGVENPAIERLAMSEIKKIKEHAKRNGLKAFEVLVGQPSLSQSFAVRVIGGRAMPSFPSTRQDCTTDWKISVQEKLRKAAFKRLKVRPDLKAPVVMTGVRIGESVKRDSDIMTRREIGHDLWKNESGNLRLSPILEWDEDEIWTYLGLANAGVISSYSDFSETMDVYRDGGGSSCVVVADMAMASRAKPCSARFGCWACTMVAKDASLRNMIESDPEKYADLRLLSDFRDFLANSQYDWSRRNFIGRSISSDGYIRVAADGYSAGMLAELLWYALSIQAETGVSIVTDQQLIAIDARWSQYALHRPFEALRIAMRVWAGERRFPPKIAEYPKTEVPDYGSVYVGSGWNDDITAEMFGNRYSDEMARKLVPTGIRSPLLEMAGECGVQTRSLNNGRWVLDFEDEAEVSVDADGASDFLQFAAPDLIKEYEGRPNCDWTDGFMTYLSYGTLAIGKGQSSAADAIVRRSQWRQRNGLNGERSLEELFARLDIAHPRQWSLFGGNDADPMIMAMTAKDRTTPALSTTTIELSESGSRRSIPIIPVAAVGMPPEGQASKSAEELRQELIEDIFSF